jgi:phage shock protein A
MADVGAAMQRAIDKTDQMEARASAVEELQAAGTFEDLTALGPGQNDVDRQLDQLGAKSAVDDEFAKLKAEIGSGAQQSALAAGAPAGDGPASSQAGGGREPGSG